MGPVWASLVPVSVMMSPRMRLERTRVCVVATAGHDIDEWARSCHALAHAGAGMIHLSLADHDAPASQVNAYLDAARMVVGNTLVAAREPLDLEVRADVVHLSEVGQRDRWPSRLVGCTVANEAEANAALEAEMDYLVADGSIEGLAEHQQSLKASYPDLIWFASGPTCLDEVVQASEQGARRILVVDPRPEDVTAYSNHLRSLTRRRREGPLIGWSQSL